MNDLQQYFAGREQFIELLEAVGIRTLEQFASADPFTVLPELHQAKRMLKLRTEIPPAPVFREWVNQALAMPIAPEPAALHASTDGSSRLPLPWWNWLRRCRQLRGHPDPAGKNGHAPVPTALRNISPPRQGARKNKATSPPSASMSGKSQKPTCAKRASST